MGAAASMPRIRLADHHFDPRDLRRIAEVLESGHLTQGSVTEEFERLVAARAGVAHAVASSSGTTALQMALHALGIGPGDLVLVPDFTHPATINAVLAEGASAHVVDVDPDTWTVSAATVSEAPFSARALIAVDTFGLAAPYTELEQIATERGMAVISDAACSLGAREGERACGAHGALGCFSFHPRKIVTSGEGGMTTTADAELAERMRRRRNHGGVRQSGRTRFLDPGCNFRLSDILSAVAIGQMQRLDEILARRGALGRRLTENLGAIAGVRPQTIPRGRTTTYQAFVVVLDEDLDRDRLIEILNERGVESTVGAYALHAEPAYAERCARAPGDLPTSWSLGRRTLALPLHHAMTDADADRVVEALGDALGHLRSRRHPARGSEPGLPRRAPA